METIVVSGPVDRVAEARAAFRQKGLRVEDSTDSVRSNVGPVPRSQYNHGFEQHEGEAFVTAYGDLNDWQVVEPLGFSLRLSWTSGTEGQWVNKRFPGEGESLAKLESLEARLRAAGIEV